MQVSIHAPAWGATLPHRIPFLDFDVSIHAPAWGATQRGHDISLAPLVSIHAPAWGATSRGSDCHAGRHGFNPRSRMGSDDLLRLDRIDIRVSIHAPAWGATSTFAVVAASSMFQSTLPHGERPDRCSPQSWTGCFNPRSRMGSDAARTAGIEDPVGFNPRSRMGSDSGPRRSGVDTDRFNPRSRMGSDNSGASRSLSRPCFNPRSRMGSDIGERRSFSRSLVSIHAPAWGAT